jgi:hypothetical protein
MAVFQSNFGEDLGLGYAGMDADGELENGVSLILEGATACAFGRPVYAGVADRGATLVVSAALRGFVRAHKGLPVTADRAADVYAPGDIMSVKERGKIWVTSTTSAANGDPVYVTAAGAITNVVGANTAAAGWVFDDTIAAAGLVRIVRR